MVILGLNNYAFWGGRWVNVQKFKFTTNLNSPAENKQTKNTELSNLPAPSHFHSNSYGAVKLCEVICSLMAFIYTKIWFFVSICCCNFSPPQNRYIPAVMPMFKTGQISCLLAEPYVSNTSWVIDCKAHCCCRRCYEENQRLCSWSECRSTSTRFCLFNKVICDLG